MSKTPSSYKSRLTGVILAGGRAERMGGQDKGLVELNGKPMVSLIIDRLLPQVGNVVINANRNMERYQQLAGCPVLSDDIEGYAGPLAGIATAMQRSTSEFVLTVPCDSPLIATDLGERLYETLAQSNAELSVAHDGQRLQPVFALLRRRLVDSLLDYLNSGERKIDTWYAKHDFAVCDLSERGDTFLNINTPAERDRIEAQVRAST